MAAAKPRFTKLVKRWPSAVNIIHFGKLTPARCRDELESSLFAFSIQATLCIQDVFTALFSVPQEIDRTTAESTLQRTAHHWLLKDTQGCNHPETA